MRRPCANLFLSDKSLFFFAEKIILAPDKGITETVIFPARSEFPKQNGMPYKVITPPSL